LSGVAVLIISGCTLSLIGFDAALGGQQDASALLLMRVILSLGTIVFSLLAFILVKRCQADRSQYQFVH
jgi:Na+/melibiose symporter-like transporter